MPVFKFSLGVGVILRWNISRESSHGLACGGETVDNKEVLCRVLRSVNSDTTQLDVELSTRSQREQLSPINERSDPVDSVCRS